VPFARPIKLYEHYPLPGTQLDLPVPDRQASAAAHKRSHQMGLGIVVNTIVPPTAPGRQLIDELERISDQAPFILVDIDRAGTVWNRDAGQSLVAAGRTDNLLHLAGYVSYLAMLGRADAKSLCRHSVIIASGRPHCLAAPIPGAVAARECPYIH